MASQGIRGPPYRLIHGNTKEISNMYKEAMSRPLSLSHNVFAYVQPHVHSWSNIYGKNYLQWFGARAQLVIREPDLCKQILNNKDGAYPKKPPEEYAKKLLGYGLVTAEAKMGKIEKDFEPCLPWRELKTSLGFALKRFFFIEIASRGIFFHPNFPLEGIILHPCLSCKDFYLHKFSLREFCLTRISLERFYLT
ncbi:putative cytochrome P450 [Rosa chinensis]|uniref:Putative cytochrome P450 n=1 Tax=Rosa chinensis TaxID=74649 RepID=A0A2P6R2E2_ROSCH|nr:putative cytochrome P450 [Rosa chinensis]